MFPPQIATRVKKSSDFARSRVDSGDIRSFVAIAVRADLRQVGKCIFSSVLSCDYMINLGGSGFEICWRVAMLTTIAGTLAHAAAQFGVHALFLRIRPGVPPLWRFRATRALECRIARMLEKF